PRRGRVDSGAVAMQVALLARVDRLLALPPGAFRPPPKVHSAVVRLTFHPPSVDIGDRGIFEKIVRGVFLQRRKTVLNALKPVAHMLSKSPETLLVEAGIDPGRRPETLTVDDFARLAQAVL